MIEIVKLTENFVVINKPFGVPSQSDASGDGDALQLTGEALLALGESPALWLVHRLDRTVGGLMVLARNKEYAARLSEVFSSEKRGKIYLAVVEGVPEGGRLVDYLYKDARIGKSIVSEAGKRGAKEARLDVSLLATVGEGSGARTLVAVGLYTGRFHQIRAQLSARGTPVVGDKKYGSRDRGARQVALFSHALDLSLGGERLSVSYMPQLSEYPWSLFEPLSYEGGVAALDALGGEI